MASAEYEFRSRTNDGQALTVMWFRQDLRLRDNPALSAAAAAGAVLPVYVLDDENAGEWKLGGASRWWLHHSLKRLNESLHGKLWVLQGDAGRELARLCHSLPVNEVVWNRCYEPWRRQQDEQVAAALGEAGIETESFNGSLLWEPWECGKKDGTPYNVFTPFYHNLLNSTWPNEPAPKPRDLILAECSQPLDRIEKLALKPQIPWDAGLEAHWTPGEAAARKQLQDFLGRNVEVYRTKRDLPAEPAVSSLSPYLHFGEISPGQVWRETHAAAAGDGANAYIRQLCWREFSYHLLYHYPHMIDQDLKSVLEGFPWRDEPEPLRCWQHGNTGVPLVDAGMRELWKTGTMHNRVRMIAASFLTKNLLIHWRRGAEWFWDCLVDADLANNSFGWQWVAGCGADAAPYFRIFNPVLQSRKYDPEGEYLRRWLPELSHLPNRHIHAPWEAGAEVLRQAGVSLGSNYPAPIVDLRASRERALAAWRTLRQGRI